MYSHLKKYYKTYLSHIESQQVNLHTCEAMIDKEVFNLYGIDGPELERLLSIFDGEKLEKELVARKYSPKTIKTYLHYNDNFLKFSGKNPHEISNTDVKDYLFHLVYDAF